MGQLNFRFFYHQLLYLDLIISVVLKYLTGPTVQLTEEEKMNEVLDSGGYEISKTMARDSYPKYI